MKLQDQVRTKIRTPLYEEQIKLERYSITHSVERYKADAEDRTKRGAASTLKPAERLMVFWFELLRRTIIAEKAGITQGKAAVGRGAYGPYFQQADTNKMAVITMGQTLSLLMKEPSGLTVTSVCHAIGSAVSAEVQISKIRKNENAFLDLKRQRQPHRADFP